MLRYIGKGKAIIGIPARDLSDEEVEKYGGEEELIATGLYEKGEEKAMKVRYENKSMMKEDDHARN